MTCASSAYVQACSGAPKWLKQIHIIMGGGEKITFIFNDLCAHGLVSDLHNFIKVLELVAFILFHKFKQFVEILLLTVCNIRADESYEISLYKTLQLSCCLAICAFLQQQSATQLHNINNLRIKKKTLHPTVLINNTITGLEKCFCSIA